ncbi:MAG: hypothetical protein WDA08_00190 [Weeksellaceae bacterium]
MKELGADVEFYDERPSNSNIFKGIIRVYPALIQGKINRYYRNILQQTKNKTYDCLLLIKGESIPLFFIPEFKKLHPKTPTIFYFYDTVWEYPRALKLFPLFDVNYTFEPGDAVNYQLKFRPSFFVQEFQQNKTESEKTFDITFIGSAHTDRYHIGEKIQKAANQQGLKTFMYYYAPNKFFFRMKRIFDKTMSSFDIKKVSFTRLSHTEVSKIYQRSFAVLDTNKPFQLGLSMRTFETLAAGRKLITTNPGIKKYPFYNPENILVIDRENPELPASFFANPFVEINPEYLEKLTLDDWLETVLSGQSDKYWEDEILKKI